MDHQNSSYCNLHIDYSNLKNRICTYLHFDKFLGTLGYNLITFPSCKLFPQKSSLPIIFNHSICMSETQLMEKTPQLHPKQSIPMSYPNSPLSPYSGALVLQFSPSHCYKFLALSLMVLYQLESLHLDDYNLIYSQNKNMGFDKFLTAFPLKTQYFPFTNIPQNQSKPIPINNTLQNST